MHTRHPLLRLILCADTRPTRLLLAVASCFWAIGLLVPGDTFMRPVYRYFPIIGGEWTWAGMWMAYSLCMLASAMLTLRRYVALALNAFGLAIWGFSSFAVLATLTHPYPAGTAPDFALLLAAFWVMIRTDVTMGQRDGE